jgi:murein DD-endopeptidase MepM/ murein hydrolase activator NlpD
MGHVSAGSSRAPFGGGSGSVDNALEALALPVPGKVTSGFGARHDPITGEDSQHSGLDVGAPEGTPIRVPAGGVVLSAGPKGGYGNAVEVDHGNGLVTLYGHAAELLVSKGEFVQPGQEIATVGSSGRSTGPHLHFEVRVGGRAVDPSRALKKYGLRAEGSHGSGP